MGRLHTTVILIAIALLLVVTTCLYTVREGQHSLLLKFGKLVRDGKTDKPLVAGPGIHFKLPVLHQVRRFDTRLQTLDVQSPRTVTAEKKDLMVDYYVKWRIEDVALYFVRTGGFVRNAEQLLRQQLNDSIRAEFGRRTIREVVTDDRAEIMNTLNTDAKVGAKKLGIEVVDVRIKRIDLPDEVSQFVYDRMRAERSRVATEHRAKGEKEAEAIRAQADADAKIIVAQARKKAADVRAAGDAIAAKTYNDAYDKDADFYAFYQSILAYRNTFNSKQDILLLQPDNQFFKYFDDPFGKKG